MTKYFTEGTLFLTFASFQVSKDLMPLKMTTFNKESHDHGRSLCVKRQKKPEERSRNFLSMLPWFAFPFSYFIKKSYYPRLTMEEKLIAVRVMWGNMDGGIINNTLLLIYLFTCI